jgi:hypothetical protein
MSEISLKLTPAACSALIDFIEAYIESSRAKEVDGWAAIAKARALVALQTDIDILVFAVATSMLVSEPGISVMEAACHGKLSARDAAIAIVTITEDAFRRDRQQRSQ